jgi:hypothetical protein
LSDPAKFEGKYEQKKVTQICNNVDVLSIYREAVRVNLLLEKKQLPVLLIHRQKKSVPILKLQTNIRRTCYVILQWRKYPKIRGRLG